ncbi:TPA: hypothetical protein DDW35_10715 [Candidatus Sumerlaeota bacterium]|nr:hypothetical protein [Candidatus Sumerlaeota bacterium]
MGAASSPDASVSHVDNYRNQNDQINVKTTDGAVKVLRVNQKDLTNQFVAKLIPVKSAKVRELRSIVRQIVALEGGAAEVVNDTEKKQTFIQVTCPPFQIPYVEEAIRGLDKDWVTATDDGTAVGKYVPKFRDATETNAIAMVYASGGIANSKIDTASNTATHLNDGGQLKNYQDVSQAADIPVSEIKVDANFFEISDNTATKIGVDYLNWKNGPGSNLFQLVQGAERAVTTYKNASSIYSPYLPNTSAVANTNVHEVLTDATQHYASTNAWITAAYFDFLKVRSKTKVLASASLHTVSGQSALWYETQSVAGISSSFDRTQSNLSGTIATLDAVTSVTTGGTTINISTYRTYILNEISSGFSHYSDLVTALNAATTVAQINTAFRAWVVLWGAGDVDADIVIADAVDAATVAAPNGAVTVYNPTTVSVNRSNWSRTVSAAQNGMVGLVLVIQPYIGTESTELSLLALDAQISNTESEGQIPVINENILETRVRVRDGETTLLAGLKRTNKAKNNVGIPFFSSIPYAGYFFGNESKMDEKSDVVITLDSTVSVNSPSKVAKTSGKLTDKMIKTVKDADYTHNCYGFDQWMLEHDCQPCTANCPLAVR